MVSMRSEAASKPKKPSSGLRNDPKRRKKARSCVAVKQTGNTHSDEDDPMPQSNPPTPQKSIHGDSDHGSEVASVHLSDDERAQSTRVAWQSWHDRQLAELVLEIKPFFHEASSKWEEVSAHIQAATSHSTAPLPSFMGKACKGRFQRLYDLHKVLSLLLFIRL